MNELMAPSLLRSIFTFLAFSFKKETFLLHLVFSFIVKNFSSNVAILDDVPILKLCIVTP